MTNMEWHMPNDNGSFPGYMALLGVDLATRSLATQQSFAPPPPAYRQDTLLQHCAAASLAGGIIAASGIAHDTDAALAVFRDVLARMYPAQG